MTGPFCYCTLPADSKTGVCHSYRCRMDAGLCVECGTEKDRTDLELCPDCKAELDREREANRRIPRDAYDCDVTR